jgi:hypothetical protein
MLSLLMKDETADQIHIVADTFWTVRDLVEMVEG